MSELHFYQCANCRSTLVAVSRAWHGRTWRCVTCHTPMKYLYTEPVVSPRNEQWARYGVLYNPGLTTCDTCGVKLTPETRIELAGVGQFCSEAHAAPAVEKHEAAMLPRVSHG
jgi:DNA-directed RNA polymerase subunit RPC12/RpoP